MSVEGTVIIRPAHESDASAVARVAARDGKPVPTGRLLVAEVEGVIVAALGIDSDERVADPFEPTAELLRLMEARASRLCPPPLPQTLSGRLLRRAMPRPRVA
jgi:hypothetical protein